MCGSKSPTTSPLNSAHHPRQAPSKPTHRGHHCPACAKHIVPHSAQAPRCLKAGQIRECPDHPGHYNAVNGYWRRHCPGCLSEQQAKKRQEKEAMAAERKRLQEKEEEAFWSRKSRRNWVETTSSAGSCSRRKSNKSCNKKQGH
jgi:hypothetical protein